MNVGQPDERFAALAAALFERNSRQLTFQEIRRALVALSSVYVERRDRLAEGAALDGAGKRAAFSCFFGPLHFLAVRSVVQALAAESPPPKRLLDLGCGTGVGSAAWASLCSPPPSIIGVDENGWALGEARFVWEFLGLAAEARRADVLTAPDMSPQSAILAAYTVNELSDEKRDRLLARLLASARQGGRVLVVEAIARRDKPYWPAWERAFTEAGGRADEWRFDVALPESVRRLAKAAGLRPQQVKARSLYLPGATLPLPEPPL